MKRDRQTDRQTDRQREREIGTEIEETNDLFFILVDIMRPSFANNLALLLRSAVCVGGTYAYMHV